KKIQKKCGSDAKIIIDAPLLIETNLKNYAEKIVVVKSDKKNLVKRLSKKYSQEQIERILKAQMPLKEKLRHADFVVENNKGMAHLERQVKEIVKKLK
ncbi:dephospho-CoA kinase, partial [Candidatus Woesearchaeota archaeon]|nr:dephospho-CoA kinase [Candidatus Woesearchaeota archaeon]